MSGAATGWKRPFFTIAAGQTVSIVGSSAVQFALIWWLASEYGSALVLSLAGLLMMLPQLLLGPFAGVWVDRLKRKNVVIAADLFIGVVAGIFALSFFIWDPPFWAGCLVIGLRAAGSVFHTPAIQAVTPMLVPSDQLMRANGLNQFLQSGAFMVGPFLGAALYSAFPMYIILLSDIVGAIFAVTAVAVVRIPEPEHGSTEQRHFMRELKEGAAAFTADRKLRNITAAMTLVMVFVMPMATFYPLMTSNYFKATAWHASAVEFAYAIGMMAGAGLVSAAGNIKNKLKMSVLGMTISGVIAVVSGLLPASMTGFWLFAALCMLLGASGNIYHIPYMSYIQENVPKEAQGRAFSLLGTLMSVTMPVGLLIAGPVSEKFGVPLWFVVGGAANIVIILATAAFGLREKRA